MPFRSVKSNGEGESSTLRAFTVLELLAGAETPPTLDELTRASGLPKPTVFRILGLLVRGGFVQREGTKKRYAVGHRMSALSFQVQMNSPMRAQRHAVLVRLVEEIGETCNFTMLDGNEVVYIDRVETNATVRLHMHVGSRVPLHCTASGKLFLANMARGEMDRLIGPGPYHRYTERTITAPAALERRLMKIRSTGVGTDVGEYLEGSVCVAVPVRDANGRIYATVAAHGPAPRMTLKKGHEFLPAMRAAAAAIATPLSPAAADTVSPRQQAKAPRRRDEDSIRPRNLIAPP
jgi:IclR family transcriptional regulator, acetate operon repressor